MATYELTSTDLFDREAPPSLEGTFAALEVALAALWKRVLEEGVQDDGRPTFTDFLLRRPQGKSVSLPRDPFHNPELAQLRACRHDKEFFGRLASVHLERLELPFDFAPFLATAARLPAQVQDAVNVLRGALSIPGELSLSREGGIWRIDAPAATAGTAARSPLMLITTSGYQRTAGSGAGRSSWHIKLPEFRFAERAVRFEVELVEDEATGWSGTVMSDHSPGTQPLQDALLAAGLLNQSKSSSLKAAARDF